MYLKSLEVAGFKSFAKKGEFSFDAPITGIVGPNGSGKSNVAEAFRFVLGEQSIKSMRGKRGEDLIFSGTQSVSKSNRASVRVAFENTPRKDGNRPFAVDYDEVALERTVHRDGSNEYRINGSAVRLRDVVELLASANIGATGHHIISQGEADRILTATPKERRAMLEDSLGLKVYQYKKSESEKKLAKTYENKAQVESLRRENAPHLKFLERQMKKLERARLLTEELLAAYKEYLKRESVYLAFEQSAIERDRSTPEAELKEVQQKIKEAREAVELSKEHDQKSDELLTLEREISESREERDARSRELGKRDGEREAARSMLEQKRAPKREAVSIPIEEVEEFGKSVEEAIGGAAPETLEAARGALERVRSYIQHFLERYKSASADTHHEEALLKEKEAAYLEAEKKLSSAKEKEAGLQQRYKTLRSEMEEQQSEGREAERRVFELMAKETELRAILEKLELRAEARMRAERAYKEELAEAGALVGSAVLAYKSHAVVDEDGREIAEEESALEPREKQEERRRALEKMKIRLEELGGTNTDDIEREYKEVSERDRFLEKEIADLEETTASLQVLIEELEEKLNAKFKEGIQIISKEFHNFFTLMFGGGSAALKVVREQKRRKAAEELMLSEGDVVPEEEEEEEGIEVDVALPNKRVKGLTMLSGGERALTSIALIFAMSRVNPPPFIILDETDAALDEANSRRYGDMIEALSEKSQLILITHNRETMSRAGVLYGVTMGADGVSKLLSVKFDEGVQFAK